MNNNKEILDEIIITYKINKKLDNNNDKIRIFGNYFVKNNKKNCNIIYGEKTYELDSFFYFKNIINYDKNNDNNLVLKLKLVGINNIENAFEMFNQCYFLSSISDDFSKWDTSKITKMNYMFSDCKSLIRLPDISFWNTSKVTDMSFMFSNCSSLLYFPDISKWDTSQVENMGWMFNGCSSISFLPDISKWNISKVIGMSCIFCRCSSLHILPNITKWDTSNVGFMNGMFSLCYSLSFIPDITKCNLEKVNFSDSIVNKAINAINIFNIYKTNDFFDEEEKNENENEND